MSDGVPIAEKRRTSYENFIVECPWCGKECIFNRRSDLGTLEPIGGLNTSCLHEPCGKAFRLVGDTVNERHETLIYDCYELMQRKHYMSCVLNLAQAYEVFFGLFLRVEILYKPFGADPDQDIADLNRLSDALTAAIKEHAFCAMRALFLRQLVQQQPPADLAESERVIAAMPSQPGDPKDSAIEALSDPDLVTLLKALKATTIHTLRNRVVHKRAYRPSRDEVDEALKETRSILFPLTSRLNIHDDINWYMRRN